MKKYLFIAAAVAAFTTPALADNYNTSSNPMNSALTGAYIGIQGGYTHTNADTAVGDANLDGGDYGVFVGYKLDQYLNHAFGINGAIEAEYSMSDADDDIGGVHVEKNHEWGVSFRPGFSISEMLNPYGILGYKRAEFEASVPGASSEENYNGFELGIGTELVTMGDYGVRAEYAHTWYDEKNNLDLDEDTVRVGLAYHF